MLCKDTNGNLEAIRFEHIDMHTVHNINDILQSFKQLFKGNGRLTLIVSGGNVSDFEVNTKKPNDNKKKPAQQNMDGEQQRWGHVLRNQSQLPLVRLSSAKQQRGHEEGLPWDESLASYLLGKYGLAAQYQVSTPVNFPRQEQNKR